VRSIRKSDFSVGLFHKYLLREICANFPQHQKPPTIDGKPESIENFSLCNIYVTVLEKQPRLVYKFPTRLYRQAKLWSVSCLLDNALRSQRALVCSQDE
jgi:hypothetical protein